MRIIIKTVKLPVWVIVLFLLLFIGLAAYAVLPMLEKEEQLWSVDDWRDYEMYVDNRSDKNIHLTVDESDPDCAAFKERVLTLCTKIKPYRPVLLYYELALGESPDDSKDSSNASSEYESTRGNFRLINITPDDIVETYYVRFFNVSKQISLDYVNRDAPVIWVSKVTRKSGSDTFENELMWYCTMPPDTYVNLFEELISYNHGEEVMLDRKTGQITIE